MKKRSIVVLALVMCVALSIGLVGCGGGNESEKAYEEWAKKYVEPSQSMLEEYDANYVEAITNGDYENALALSEARRDFLIAGLDALLTIDSSKLSAANAESYANNKTAYEGLVEKMQVVAASLAIDLEEGVDIGEKYGYNSSVQQDQGAEEDFEEVEE